MKMNYGPLFSVFGLFILVQSGPMFGRPESWTPKTASIEDRVIIRDYRNEPYVDLSRSRSNLIEVIAEIRALDNNENSFLEQFSQYVEDGNAVALKDSVLDVLVCAESVLEGQSNKIPQDQLEKINDLLDMLAFQIDNGNLSINRSFTDCDKQCGSCFSSPCCK